MDLGVTMFFTDRTIGPVELATELEERGFQSLWVPEHTHIPTSRRTPAPIGPELAEQYYRTLDPFVVLATVAAVTTNLRFGTGIALMAQRDPIVTAKEVATLDLLSGGRLDFGVGYGWNIEELEDHGGSRATRRDVVRERVLAMQGLWADDVSSFKGDHVQFSESFAWPKPVQQVRGRSGVPVLLGGSAGPRFFAHLAEFCDGWIPVGGAGLAAAMDGLRQAFDEAGRSTDELRIVPFGTIPDEGKLARYAELGVTECVLGLPSADRDEVLRVLDDHTRFVA
jgi:probable F420-dependent oxidoreductase